MMCARDSEGMEGNIFVEESKSIDALVIMEEHDVLISMSADQTIRFWDLMDLQTVKDARRKEAEDAATALGVHDLVCMDLGDYPLELTREHKNDLVDVIRRVQPAFMMSHSKYDPYNTDHMYTTQVALEARMIAQAWGHNPGEKVLGAPQLYLFEPHQTEQMGWKPDTFLDITPVWDKKRAAMECMDGQVHLWDFYTRVAQQRANHFKRNSGGMSGGRDCKYAEGFESIFPRTVDEL